MQKFFFYFCFLFSTVSFAQNKSFDIVLGGGKYWTPARKPIHGGRFFNAEFEYHYKNRWSFSSGLIVSNLYSFINKDSTLNNILIGYPYANISTGREFQTNFMAKYEIYRFKKSTFQIGAGLALIIMNKSEQRYYMSKNSIEPYFELLSDLGFPMSAEIYTRVTKNISIGAKFGSFIYPDYPMTIKTLRLEVIGNNIGLQARFSL